MSSLVTLCCGQIRSGEVRSSRFHFLGHVQVPQGHMNRWRCNHWCTKQGPAPNADLWMDFLEVVEQCIAQVGWLWIPSHVSIPRMSSMPCAKI